MRGARKHFLCASTGLTLFAALSGVAMAQTAPGAAAASNDAPEEIVVTAEKRESALLETPLAVAAITTQQLERQGIASLEDVQAITPNLTYGSFSSFSIVSLRGVGTDFGTISAEPSVATFQDGVYLGASSAQTAPSFDLQRIEVLRGPQGTLYGRNSTGGAINFITRDPTFTNEVNGALTVGDYDRVTADLGVSGPLGLHDTLAGRLSVRYDTHDFRRQNDTPGVADADNLQSRSGAGSLLIRPDDNTKIVLRADYMNRDSASPYERIDDALGFNTLFGGSFTSNPAHTTHFRNDTPTSTNFEVWGLSATGDFQIGTTTLRSISAYRQNTVNSNEDWDGSDAFILAVNDSDSSRQFTQEFNLLGTTGALDWLLGTFYYKAEGSTFFDLSGGAIGLLGASTLTFAADQDSQSIAGFSQGTYHLSDRLNVTAGLRYTHDEKSMHQQILINHVFDTCGRTTSDSWNALTGTLGADYHVTDDAIVYGRFSRGFKAGGINAGQCADGFNPEYVNAFETGLRGTLFDHQLSGALTAFYYDYKDIQFTTFSATTATIDNVGGAKVAGLELEYNLRPAFAHGLRVDGSVSYLHSEYNDEMVQDPFLTGPYQIGGNQLVRAPEWRANIGVEYTFGFVANSDLTFRAESEYSDHYYHDIFNGKAALQADTREPSYTISNFRVIWQPSDHAYELQAFVENIEDHQYAYRRFVGASFGGTTGQFSPPRTAGIRISTHFGS